MNSSSAIKFDFITYPIRRRSPKIINIGTNDTFHPPIPENSECDKKPRSGYF